MLKKVIYKIRDINEALLGMFFIDFIYLILGECLIVLFTSNPEYYGIGFLTGVIYSVFASVHMSLTIRKVVYGNTSSTKGYLIGYVIRLVIMIAILTALFISNKGDLLCAVIGMFSMKVSAYLQPFTDRKNNKRRVRRWVI